MRRHYAIAAVVPFMLAGVASAATMTQTLNTTWDAEDGLVAYGSIVVPDAIASINSFTIVMAAGWDQDLDITINGFDGVDVFMLYDLMYFEGDGSMLGDGAGTGLANVASYTFVPMGTAGADPDFGGFVSPGGLYESNATWTTTPFTANSEFILAVGDLFAGDGGAVQSWSIDYTPLPAPGAIALLGLAGVAGRRRRRA